MALALPMLDELLPVRVLLYSPHPDVRALIDQLLGVHQLGQVLIYPTFVDLYAAAFEGQGELAIVDSLGSHAGLQASELEALGGLRGLIPIIFLADHEWASTSSPDELQVTAVLRKPFELDELVAAIQQAANVGRPSAPTT